MDLPAEWKQKVPWNELAGVCMVIGASNAGKSTFAQYAFAHLCQLGRRAAFMDGDPGQSSLGPPTTITLGIPEKAGEFGFPPQGPAWRCFIGSTTPYGHMLPMLVGVKRLVRAAHKAEMEIVIHDTCGLIEAPAGLELKMAKIDLLQPQYVIAIHKKHELDSLLLPLRRSRRTRLIELHPSEAARSRSLSVRQEYRADRYARYFSGAVPVLVDWSHLAVFPEPRFYPRRLVAFENQDGFCLGLGIVLEYNLPDKRLVILTPYHLDQQLDAIRVGDILLEPQSFRDERLEQ